MRIEMDFEKRVPVKEIAKISPIFARPHGQPEQGGHECGDCFS